MQATNRASKVSTLGLKPRVDVTSWGTRGPKKKELTSSKTFIKLAVLNSS